MEVKLGGYLPSMNGKLISHQGEVFSLTWVTKWNYALRCRYSDDIDHIPAITSGGDLNSYVEILSTVPNRCTIDWGDGNIESFNFVRIGVGTYNITFRSLNVPWRKDPNDGFATIYGTGEIYGGVAPHKYDDDKDKRRVVSIVFDQPFHNVTFNTPIIEDFPIVISSGLNYLNLNYTGNRISSIPFDSFQYIPNLENLYLTQINSSLIPVIPDSIFSLTKLKVFVANGLFDLSDIESSGIRNISKMKSLNFLRLFNSRLAEYIEEFNDLLYLRQLEIGNNGVLWGDYEDVNQLPSFDNVSSINQNLIGIYFLKSEYNNYRTEFTSGLSGKGFGNITSLDIGAMGKLNVSHLPDYLYEWRSLVVILCESDTLVSTERVDEFVDTFYDFVTTWDQITYQSAALDGLRNQFFGLEMRFYSEYTDPGYRTARPSGIYQAPSGFEQGVSDGNPQTPMEKIYVLENNYSQNWIIAPEN